MTKNNNICFVGDTSVGKTSIIMRQKNGEANTAQPSIGVGHVSTTVNGIELMCYDTAGQESYRSLCPMFIRNSSIIVIVFDVTQSGTFKNIRLNWLEFIFNIKEPPFILIVGNKTDSDLREVTFDEGLSLTLDISRDFYNIQENKNIENIPARCIYFETSAKTGNGIQQLFDDIASKVKYLENPNRKKDFPTPDPTPGPTPVPDPDPKNKCC